MINTEDDEKSDLTEFCRVTRKFCERLEFFKDKYTVQNEAFHVSFESTEFSEKDSEIKSKKNKQVSSSTEKNCKKAVMSQKESSKKVMSECSVCDMREHSLAEC